MPSDTVVTLVPVCARAASASLWARVSSPESPSVPVTWPRGSTTIAAPSGPSAVTSAAGRPAESTSHSRRGIASSRWTSDLDASTAGQPGGGGVHGVDLDADPADDVAGLQQLAGGGDHLRLHRAGEQRAAGATVAVDEQHVGCGPRSQPVGGDHSGDGALAALRQPGLGDGGDALHVSSLLLAGQAG